MKKILIFLVAIVFLTINFSCKKKVNDYYPNPNSATPPTGNLFAGFFTNELYAWKFIVQDYGEYWWESDLGVGYYIQTHSRYATDRYKGFLDPSLYNDFVNGNGFEYGNAGENGAISQFNSCYTAMRDWGTMNGDLKSMSAADQQDVLIYYQLSTVFKDVWCARLVDMFNKIPYFDAFKGNQAKYFPAYDDPKAIYDSIINDLITISGALPGTYNNMSTAGKTLFANQDIAFSGNITTWVQYINSQLLKFGVRISGVDQTNSTLAINAAIKNLPTTDLQFATHRTELPPGGVIWLRGVYETMYTQFVPNVIEKRMNFGGLEYDAGGVDDPRLPVICMPTKFDDYRGLTYNTDTNKVYYNAGDKYYPYGDNLDASLSTNARSMYNLATYAWNEPNFPAKMITLAEVDLFLAEVELKGLATTGESADMHINDAVVHSCNYWYAINALNASWRPDVPAVHPTKVDADITAYAAKVQALFNAQTSVEDKMEIIMQQKYIHLNISDNYELWAELRRTRHPLLEPFTMDGVTVTPQPERLMYPASELQNNKDQFLKVSTDNNFTSPVFWVPSDKVAQSFYGTFLGAY